MLRVLITFIFTGVAVSLKDNPAAQQCCEFQNTTKSSIGTLTTSAGAPVDCEEATSTLNTNLFTNEYFVDTMTHFVRERIPERVVHAPGVGALGYFEVTRDISHICKAKLFSKVGKRTPVACRFSLAFQGTGVSDTVRDLRGFAIKFYTEEGIFDLVGLNTPIASVKEPVSFSNIVHAGRRNPASNLPDSNALWDVLTLRPEVIFLFMYIYSDFGVPDGYAHMSSFPAHLYEVYNEEGKKSYVKFHILPCAGTKNLNSTELKQISAEDPDYYTRGLYNSIANGKYPSWQMKIQILSEEDVKQEGSDAYDVTRTLSLEKYPLHLVGKLTLDKNPSNHFAEIEQLAYSPGNLVPGIMGSPDKIFETRRVVYRDAQNYRLGANFKKIPVNCPMGVKTLTYNRDGVSPVNDNGKDSPNYFPNSAGGSYPFVEKNKPKLSKIIEKPANNFDQASNFYANELNSIERSNLVNNLVQTICPCNNDIKSRAVQRLKSINLELGNRIAKGLRNCTKI